MLQILELEKEESLQILELDLELELEKEESLQILDLELVLELLLQIVEHQEEYFSLL